MTAATEWVVHAEGCVDCEAAAVALVVELVAAIEGGIVRGAAGVPLDGFCAAGRDMLRRGAAGSLAAWETRKRENRVE